MAAPLVLPRSLLLQSLRPYPNPPLFLSRSTGTSPSPIGCLYPTCGVPPPGWLKANVNVSLYPSGDAGIGIVVRDENDNFLKAVGHKLWHWDATTMELQAILYISKITEPWMFEYKGIIIEGDCIGVVNHMRNNLSREIWKNKPKEGPYINFLRNFHQVIFAYTSRNNNRLTYFCADTATGFDFIWFSVDSHTIPPQFFVLLEEDIAHIVAA